MREWAAWNSFKGPDGPPWQWVSPQSRCTFPLAMQMLPLRQPNIRAPTGHAFSQGRVREVSSMEPESAFSARSKSTRYPAGQAYKTHTGPLGLVSRRRRGA